MPPTTALQQAPTTVVCPQDPGPPDTIYAPDRPTTPNPLPDAHELFNSGIPVGQQLAVPPLRYEPPTRLTAARGRIEAVRFIRSDGRYDLWGHRARIADEHTHQCVTAVIAVRATTLTVVTRHGEIIHKSGFTIDRHLRWPGTMSCYDLTPTTGGTMSCSPDLVPRGGRPVRPLRLLSVVSLPPHLAAASGTGLFGTSSCHPLRVQRCGVLALVHKTGQPNLRSWHQPALCRTIHSSIALERSPSQPNHSQACAKSDDAELNEIVTEGLSRRNSNIFDSTVSM